MALGRSPDLRRRDIEIADCRDWKARRCDRRRSGRRAIAPAVEAGEGELSKVLNAFASKHAFRSKVELLAQCFMRL